MDTLDTSGIGFDILIWFVGKLVGRSVSGFTAHWETIVGWEAFG